MTIFGASIGGAAGETIASQDTRYGPLKVVRVFYPGMPGSLPAGTNTSRVMHVSFKTGSDFTGMAQGTYTAALGTWLRAQPANQPILLTYAHEPEANNKWPSGAAFAAAQDAFIKIVRDAIAAGGVTAKVQICTVFTAYILTYGRPGGSSHNIASYWPTKYTPDMVGFDFDGYTVGSAYPDFTATIGYAKAFAASKGIPWSVCEFGNQAIATDSTHAGRAAWLTSTGNAFAAAGATYVELWDDDLDTPTNHSLDHLTTTNEINAWAALVGSTPTQALPAAPASPAAASAPDGTYLDLTVAAAAGSDNVTGRDWYIATGNTTTLKKANATPTPASQLTYRFPNLIAGQQYSIASVAINAAGRSPFSTILHPVTASRTSNHSPVITGEPSATVHADDPFTFDFAATASDPDGNAISYRWDFAGPAGAVPPLLAASGTVTFPAPGSYAATLTVADNGTPPLQAVATLPISVAAGAQTTPLGIWVPRSGDPLLPGLGNGLRDAHATIDALLGTTQTVTASQTLPTTKSLTFVSGAGITLTLPTVAAPGTVASIINTGASSVTIAGAVNATAVAAGASARLATDGTSWYAA